MKKLIFLFLFITGYNLSFAQEEVYLSMAPQLEPAVEQFVQDAKKRGYYVRTFLMEKVEAILFTDELLYDDRLGVADLNTKIIWLSPLLTNYPSLLRVTVYHEIGHIIKDSGYHVCAMCTDIMSSTAPADFNIYDNKELLERELDKYFTWLNQSE